MNKNKLIFTVFIALIASISGINAMEVDESDGFRNIKTVEINVLPFEKTEDRRGQIVKKLLSEFDSSVKEDFTYDLRAIKKYYNTGYDFGNKASNYRSLGNWIVYTRSLGALAKLGHEEDGIKLKEELERAKRRLEVIDVYADDKDYKYCLLGIWSIVATFDKEERRDLLEALKKGEEVPNDATLIKFFESSN